MKTKKKMETAERYYLHILNESYIAAILSLHFRTYQIYAAAPYHKTIKIMCIIIKDRCPT
jgi:hypothetical protein